MANFLIIGSGRLAAHFNHYLQLLGYSPQQWNRKDQHRKNQSREVQPNKNLNNRHHQLNHPQNQNDLETLAQNADRILLCVSDAAIEDFYLEHLTPYGEKVVHFSGALHIEGITNCHLLSTFSNQLFDLEIYKNIPLIYETGTQNFITELPNPRYFISSQQKSLYHAACVMAGNFSTLLWQNTAKIFTDELNLPAEILNHYLQQILMNFQSSPSAALTGPLARGDIATLIKNLDSLRDRPEQALYYAFLNFYLEKNKKIGDLEHERLNI